MATIIDRIIESFRRKPAFLQQNDSGQEIPDDTPIVIRLRGQTITDFDRVREFIKRELREHQTGQVETFDEANDFDVEDDLFPVSPHEYSQDTEAADREALLAGDPSRPKPVAAAPGVESSSGGGVQPPPAPPVTPEAPAQ